MKMLQQAIINILKQTKKVLSKKKKNRTYKEDSRENLRSEITMTQILKSQWCACSAAKWRSQGKKIVNWRCNNKNYPIWKTE